MDALYQKFIKELMAIEVVSPKAFFELQRKFCKQNQCQFLKKDLLYANYKIMLKHQGVDQRQDILNVLQMKNVRSQSGIAVVSVLTKPYPCPGECIYCPTQVDVPKSYLDGEPAVMRAKANNYDPYKQVFARLKALKDTGHVIDKISIRIIGGTWSYYARAYQNWFIRRLFRAANEFEGNICEKTDLESLQDKNVTAANRIVELSIETRQDYINYHELLRLRKYGVTKIEIGVQSLDDRILKLNKRGHDISATIAATKLLKDFGFKVSYQMMLNLYDSNYQKDLKTFKKLFDDEHFKPDHLKIYPLAVIKGSKMNRLVTSGKHRIYTKEELTKLIADIKYFIPRYCRVERVIRDIPASQILEGGAKVSNLRQCIEDELKTRNYNCQCIRCREIKGTENVKNIKIMSFEYQASGAKEIFISAENSELNKVIGFCRLRLNKTSRYKFLSSVAIIREIHVYGPTVSIGNNNQLAHQHQGWGKRMINEAEKIAKINGYRKIAVIAGVGVRGYFERLGYRQNNTYLIKYL